MTAVSYVKATIPHRIEAGSAPIDAPTHALLTAILTDGLAEFAWENELDLGGWFDIEVTDAPANPATGPLPAGPLVPVGGGKDSIVTLEAVRDLGPTLFAVNPRGPITRTIDVSRMPSVRVTRQLDPVLFDLNYRGALNGHVPVTAIVSAAAVVSAVLGDHDAVLLSNEASADQPTLVVDGREVNHQWSKGSAFERAFADLVRTRVHSDLRYLSFLRPAGELAIARRFAAIDTYDAAVNSCNRAFHLQGETTEWCGDCPKCRFVFLALAPFTSRERVIGIVGRDLLDDPTQVDGFRALARLGVDKPFECVGESEESLAALRCLASRPQWRDRAVIAALRDETGAGCDDLESRLSPGDAATLPPDLREAFRAAF